MFLHLSVILFMGGFCLSACWDATPPRTRPPGTRRPRDQTPPRTRHSPHQMATAADGTHPTGMHSCYFFISDINECYTATHNCDPHASCSNSPFPYSCACNSGYTGNGFSCTGNAMSTVLNYSLEQWRIQGVPT